MPRAHYLASNTKLATVSVINPQNPRCSKTHKSRTVYCHAAQILHIDFSTLCFGSGLLPLSLRNPQTRVVVQKPVHRKYIIDIHVFT